MKVTGKIYKDGKFWLADVPAFDLLTQGRTKEEAKAMLIDWFETMLDEKKPVKLIGLTKDGEVTVHLNESKKTFALLLQRQRQKSGLSIREVSAILGYKNHNAYAAYERGSREPTISVAAELMRAVSAQELDLLVA